MTARFVSGILALILSFGSQAAMGQDIGAGSVGAEEKTRAEPTPTDEAFEPLRATFANLYRTLQSMGGVTDENRPAVEKLVAESQSFVESNPDYVPGLALRLQLAMWMEEHEQVESLFEQLIALEPDRTEFADAWLRYAQNREDEAVVEKVFDRLTVAHRL